MKHITATLMLFTLVTLSSCSDWISSRPIHSPIYPKASEPVELMLSTNSVLGIKSISLYQTISNVLADGRVNSGSEVLIQNWEFKSGSRENVEVSHDYTNGYPKDSYVSLRWLVESFSTSKRNHYVNFVTDPYRIDDQPAPIFAQGDIESTFDIILIPDEDIDDMDQFKINCQSLITNSIHRESTLNWHNKRFNFYINPSTGVAAEFDTDNAHELPSNNDNLSFADVKVIMHKNELRDYRIGDLFSMEWDRPQTFLHENGHAMFELRDEYEEAYHVQLEILPNNWESRESVIEDAQDRGKTEADGVEMGRSGWYKLCNNECPMVSGPRLLFEFDTPCKQRIEYVLQNL